ncbi:MAG: RNA polymerase sigma factor [Planctomycetota bacterium]
MTRPARSPPPTPPELDALVDGLYRYALALGQHPAAAEDAVQEVLLRACRNRGPWDPPYLAAAVRNQIIDTHRADTRRKNREQASTRPPASDPAWEPDDAMQNALAALRREEREALFLSVVDGWTASQIAKLTHKPRGTVLSLLHRAKAKLRQRLDTPAPTASHD